MDDYRLINSLTASLSISSSGTATCKGSVTPLKSSYGSSLTMTLRQKINGVWKDIKTWSKSGTGISGTTNNQTHSVSSGTYILHLSGTVTNVGDKETGTLNSPEKSR